MVGWTDRGNLLPPPRARDRGCLLQLRATDLPGLHDELTGRDALSRVRAPHDEGAHDPLDREPRL
jgi:hypothetical protein